MGRIFLPTSAVSCFLLPTDCLRLFSYLSMYDNTASRKSHLPDTFVVSTSCRRPTYRAFSRLFNCLPRARARQPVRSSRYVNRLHDILTAGVPYVHPTVQLSSPCATSNRPRQPSSRNVAVSAVVTKRRRLHDLLISGLLSSNCNKLDITAVERIQLAVRSCDRRPHQLSFYSTQQNDAKDIVDFVLHKARFYDYFFWNIVL